MTTKNLPNNQSTIKICSVDDCNVEMYGFTGYCHKHYTRNRVHGDPSICKTYRGDDKAFAKNFWTKVKKDANENGCWEWQGALADNGYGKSYHKKRHISAHRLAFWIYHERKPVLNLLHSCDNKKCVNPAHLREGTAAENAQEAIERGLTCKGMKNAAAKLTDSAVIKIRELFSQKISGIKIAKMYNVSIATVYDIKNRKIWRHI